MRLLILFLVIASHNVQPAKILGLYPHVGWSHFKVFEPLLKDLAQRGHQLTVVSFFPQKEPLANYTDVSLHGFAEERREAIDLKEYDKRNIIISSLGLDLFMSQMNDIQPLKHMALKICSKLVESKSLAKVLEEDYDVVLVESFNSDCMLGLLHVHKVQAPVIALSSCPLMQWVSSRIGVSDNPSYVPAVSSKFTSRMSFVQRLENAFTIMYYKLWFRYKIQVNEHNILERHFERKLPDLEVLARNVTLMLVNTFHSLNGVRPLLPGVVEVGGMHLKNRESQAIPHLPEEPRKHVVMLVLGGPAPPQDYIIKDTFTKLVGTESNYYIDTGHTHKHKLY